MNRESTTRQAIRFVRLSLVVVIYINLFLPWWDREGTDLAGANCPPECPPVNGFWMWIAWAGWVLCVPAIPLVTLLPSAIAASIRPNQATRGLYRLSLVFWLLAAIAFAWLNTSNPSYVTPYIGFALSVAAVILEVVDGVVASRERRLAIE